MTDDGVGDVIDHAEQRLARSLTAARHDLGTGGHQLEEADDQQEGDGHREMRIGEGQVHRADDGQGHFAEVETRQGGNLELV